MSYKGDITSLECFELLKADPQSQLVDVRTSAEWSFVGIPDLSSIGKQVVHLQWQEFPQMMINSSFAQMLEAELTARGIDKQASLAFLCRSGGRSQSAASAATAAGYVNSFNILGGFEGDKDSNEHRGNLEGWKHDNLPWRQG